MQDCLPDLAKRLEAVASRPPSPVALLSPEAAQGAEDTSISDDHALDEDATSEESDSELEDEEHEAWRQSLATLQLPRYKVASPPPDEPELEEHEADEFYECPREGLKPLAGLQRIWKMKQTQ
jgi:hypothetical protein